MIFVTEFFTLQPNTYWQKNVVISSNTMVILPQNFKNTIGYVYLTLAHARNNTDLPPYN
jgi:hypothetical protein